MKLKFLVSAVVTMFLATASAVVSPTASSAADPAPTLPVGWTMYAVDCEDQTGQLYTVDTTTGITTAVGDAATNGNFDAGQSCAAQGSYNPVTQMPYFLNWGCGGVPDYLASADVVSGKFTNVGTIIDDLPSGNQWESAVTFDAAGTLFALNKSNKLSTINLQTGAATEIASAPALPSGFRKYAMAVNPADGEIYGFVRNNQTDNGNTNLEIVTLSKTTGVMTRTGKYVDETSTGLNRTNANPSAMAVDSNGIAWVRDDGSPNSGTGLIAVDLATGATWTATEGLYNSTLYPDSFNTPPSPYSFYSMSIWLVPGSSPEPPAPPAPPTPAENTLAKTGSVDAMFIPGAVLLVLLGGAAIALRRRSRQQ